MFLLRVPHVCRRAALRPACWWWPCRSVPATWHRSLAVSTCLLSQQTTPDERLQTHKDTVTHRKRTFSVVTSPGLVFHVHVGVKKSVCRSIYAEENVTLFAFDIFSKWAATKNGMWKKTFMDSDSKIKIFKGFCEQRTKTMSRGKTAIVLCFFFFFYIFSISYPLVRPSPLPRDQTRDQFQWRGCVCFYLCNNRSVFHRVWLFLSTWLPPSGLGLPLLVGSLERVLQLCGKATVIQLMIPVAPCGEWRQLVLMVTLHVEQRLILNNLQQRLGVDDCTVLACSQNKGRFKG